MARSAEMVYEAHGEEGISASCDCDARMVMLEFYRKGTAVLLTYGQAGAVERLLRQALRHDAAPEAKERR